MMSQMLGRSRRSIFIGLFQTHDPDFTRGMIAPKRHQPFVHEQYFIGPAVGIHFPEIAGTKRITTQFIQ